MIIKVLMEDTALSSDFVAEHGLSLYIEANGKKILFDSGQSAAFADNAKTLGVDLSQVDFAVLSHAHYDHSGGLDTFLALNSHAPVYLSPSAFDEYRNASRKFIGVDPALKENNRIVYAPKELKIDSGITLYASKQEDLVQPVDAYGLCALRDGTLAADDFRHEQYLEIIENGKRILISGCSHKGIANIVNWFKPDVLIGGFHLFKLDPAGSGRQALDTVRQYLADTSTIYYTCHCTGITQYQYLKQEMPDTLFYITAGQEILV